MITVNVYKIKNNKKETAYIAAINDLSLTSKIGLYEKETGTKVIETSLYLGGCRV